MLVALAAWADPTELARLEAVPAGGQLLAGSRISPNSFGSRYDARQKQVHRQTNRFWPQALGTTPWGAARWLRDHVPAAGRYRVRLVDDTSPADVEALLSAVDAALAAGQPVPLVVGSLVPRHYVLALCRDGDGPATGGGSTSRRAGRCGCWPGPRCASGGWRRCWASTGCTRRCCRPERAGPRNSPRRNAELARAGAGGTSGQTCRTPLVDSNL